MNDISREVAAQAPSSGFASDEYNEVAKSALLEGIILQKSAFNLNPECLQNRESWKLEYGWKLLHCSFNGDGGSVAGIFEYHFTAKDGRKHAAKCAAEYAVFYRTKVGAKEEAARAFCRTVGMFAAYPYFRALVSRFSSEANLNLPMLPTIASTAHIPPKKKG
ncbi:hypothetical protein [Alterisphingorhabdus coralli]|uniref:Uncharacterized protein n=1 Tax=Alterisphingorhabdus coralli TaxID=3071408 RepID=A0AA97I114_9SPHN|nr:hypothetical protein [Parasphingorhabdus sp. SCSIO 66989]WOE74898.1 hypothetical protein RB602_13825 [Parasphingorhabdus sp. SCSIO 66989]